MHPQSTRLPRGTGKSEQICPVCGAPFLAYASEHRLYCSKPCQLIGHPKTQPYNPEKRDAAFWAKVRKTDRCWLWSGMANPSGYGEMKQDGRVLLTHRIAFEQAYGPIPDGMFVLHTCDNPACVRNDDKGTYELNGVSHPRHGHLWLGTQQDNQADKIAKNRQAKGDTHYSRTKPERVARGERSGAVTHPERIARGDRNGSRTHPERLARGERHGSVTHPERVPRGDQSGLRLHPDRAPKGERNGFAKLTEQAVREIRAQYAQGGTSHARLAAEFGVTKATVTKILLRQAWKHVD